MNIFRNPDIPKWSMVRSPIHMVNRESDTLLITVGDSWTWGDSLGEAKARLGRDDSGYRLTHVYGYLLSEQLKCDWINLALPGISNTWMISELDSLLSSVTGYKKITCTITLTESGRHEDHSGRHNTEWTLEELLDHLLEITYQQIDRLREKYPTVNFVVAHNFTDPIGNRAIPQSWLEVMLARDIKNNTRIVVSEHIEQLNYDFIYPDTPSIIDRALDRIALLDSCEYCHKEDTRHPNEQGHQLWANYLLYYV